MSARSEAKAWAETVRALAADRGLRYEPVGGLNPRDAPPALCPGGRNRVTGELDHGFFGASCDADEREQGGFWGRSILPGAVLVKSHMPDLAEVVPAFNVESVEGLEVIEQRASRRRVEFESIEFNRRYIATVPRDHDPIALRELFSPAFLDWAAGIDAEVDFGIGERQLYFMWRLRERTRAEYERALAAAGELCRRVRAEMVEHGVHTYDAGPWHAGLAPFPEG
ncbi:MAG TPA: hypothetical protein VIL04_02545 [Solirubrobacterales bacterium]